MRSRKTTDWWLWQMMMLPIKVENRRKNRFEAEQVQYQAYEQEKLLSKWKRPLLTWVCESETQQREFSLREIGESSHTGDILNQKNEYEHQRKHTGKGEGVKDSILENTNISGNGQREKTKRKNYKRLKQRKRKCLGEFQREIINNVKQQSGSRK